MFDNGGMFDDESDHRLDDDGELPAGMPRHGDPRKGWPKVRKPTGPGWTYYYRPSGLAEPAENPWAIERRNKRLLIWAAARHLELLAQAAAVTDWGNDRLIGVTDPDEIARVTALIDADKKQLDQLIGRLHDRAGGDRAADRGTAVHSYAEQWRAGQSLAHLPEQLWRAVQVGIRLIRPFRVIAMEQLVICDELTACGTFDVLGELIIPMAAPDGEVLPAGTRFVLDWKTGDHDIKNVGYLAQHPCYNRGVPYDWRAASEGGDDGFNGRRDWPDGIAPHRKWVIIIHIPLNRLEDAGLTWLNTEIGAQAARKANEIRDHRRWINAAPKRAFRPLHLTAEQEAQLPEVVGLEYRQRLEVFDHETGEAGGRGEQVRSDMDAAKAVLPAVPENVLPMLLDDMIAAVKSGPDAHYRMQLLWAANEAAWTERHNALAVQHLAALEAE